MTAITCVSWMVSIKINKFLGWKTQGICFTSQPYVGGITKMKVGLGSCKYVTQDVVSLVIRLVRA